MDDASGIMLGTYVNYAQNPNNFTISKHGERHVLMRTQPHYGFLGIQIVRKPFWFCANVVQITMEPDAAQIVKHLRR